MTIFQEERFLEAVLYMSNMLVSSRMSDYFNKEEKENLSEKIKKLWKDHFRLLKAISKLLYTTIPDPKNS